MALIETTSGDFDVPVRTTEKLMQPAEVTFTIPADLAQAQAGSLNEWQPVNVHIPDGGTLAINLPCWVTKLTANGSANGNTVDVEARDASVWLWQIGRDTPWSGAAAVNELLASNTDNYEIRQPNAVLKTDSSLWIGDWGIVTGTTANPGYTLGQTTSIPAPCYQQAIPGTTTTTADATIAFSWPAFRASGASVSRVRVTLSCDLYQALKLSWPNAAPNWTLTVNASRDGGVTWGPDHTLTTSYGDFAWQPDLSADAAWVPADFTSAGNVQVRLTATPSGNTTDNTLARRYVTAVTLDVAYAPIFGYTMPVLPGAIDANGANVRLPTGHKMLNEWFQDLTEQTAYEWAIRPSARLGWGYLDWQQAVGGTFATTVTLQGRSVPIAGLEVGQFSSLPNVDVDGMAAVNRVYAYATNSSGVTVSAVADDVASQAVIGVHELIVQGNSTDSTATLQSVATKTLAARQQSQVAFSVTVPRVAGLWSACRLGATLIYRGSRMPFAAWEGTARIVERAIDEGSDTMLLTLLPIRSSAPQPVASGMAVWPNRTAQQVKYAPSSNPLRLLRQVLTSYWHPRKR